MDQMKPWYAQAFDMTNILWLQHHGVNFKRATVGQMASRDGREPQHDRQRPAPEAHGLVGRSDASCPSADEGRLERAADGEFWPAGSIVTVGDLSYLQYQQLIEDVGYPKLGDYMHKAFPGSKIVANLGGKYYQVDFDGRLELGLLGDVWQQEGRRPRLGPALDW